MSNPYVLAIDTETDGFDWFDGCRPFIITASDHASDLLFRCDDPAQIAEFRELALGADVWVFHNAKFDIHHLIASGVFTYDEVFAREVHDTEVLARLTLPQHDVPNFRLKTLGSIFVSADAKDDETELREKGKAMGLIQRVEQDFLPMGFHKDVWDAYPQVVEAYALKDTRLTYDLYHVLKPKLNESTSNVFKLECDVLPVLVRMEQRGTALDHAKVAALHTKHTTEYAEVFDKLVEWSGDPEFMPTSAECTRQLMEAQGVELTEHTQSGQLAVHKAALLKAARFSDNDLVPEIVDTLMEARSHAKFLSTYIEPMMGREAVHPDFRQVQAWTGRQSCARPNMQNIPVRSGPEVREMFVPRPGYSLVVADYSSIELRLLAYYMGHQGLWDVINSGDPFMWLGEQVFGDPDPANWPVPRQPLKNGFYAMTYGAGGPKFADTVGGGLTAEEGREIIKRIKATLNPNYKQLTDAITQRVRTRGYVKTLAGRHNYVPYDKAYVGLNALIQGSAADIMKYAMVQVHEYIQTIGGYILLTVHDEIVCEVPTDVADKALDEICARMRSAQNLAAKGGLELKVAGTVCHGSYSEAK